MVISKHTDPAPITAIHADNMDTPRIASADWICFVLCDLQCSGGADKSQQTIEVSTNLKNEVNEQSDPDLVPEKQSSSQSLQDPIDFYLAILTDEDLEQRMEMDNVWLEIKHTQTV